MTIKLDILWELDVLAKCYEIPVSSTARQAAKEIRKLRKGIRKTIANNMHLADGENCTLIDLKKALQKVKV